VLAKRLVRSRPRLEAVENAGAWAGEHQIRRAPRAERQRHQVHGALDSASRRAHEADERGDRPAAAREQAIAAHAHQLLEQLAAHTDRLDQRQQNPPKLSEPALARSTELHHRDHVQRLALLIDPPAHVTAALGPVPERLDARERWQQTAERIERYRDHYGITDPEQALGENPQELRQRSDRRQLRHEIQQHRGTIAREPNRGGELER